MGFLKGQDIISGQEATVFANIGGKNVEMFYVKNFEAIMEKNKEEIKTIGKRGTQHKTVGFSGTGSMTCYHVTSMFAEMAQKYVNEGKDTFFDVKVTNDDPTSSVGRQTVLIKQVNLDSIPIAMVDVDSSGLEEELAFTWDGFELLEKFKEPVLG